MEYDVPFHCHYFSRNFRTVKWRYCTIKSHIQIPEMAHFFYLYVRDGFIPNNLMSNFALCPSVFLVPHIFAWSFFFLLCTPVHFSSSPPLFHTQPRTHTHNSVTNNSVTHNSVCKYWKKLKCEVIWSFNFSFGFYVSQ